MNAALIVIWVAVLCAIALGLGARFRRQTSLAEWAVATRGLGSVFVFLLLAGEHFSAFVFLGGSGYAYGHGGAAYYAMTYSTLAFALAYWLLPPIWRYAKENDLISQPDFFRRKYGSQALGGLVSTIGILALIPYMVLQFRALGIIVSVASYGSISSDTAVWIAAVVITLFVVASGIRGSAWASILKDGLIVVVAVFLGIYLPLHYYGGYRTMFTVIQHTRPGFLALPAQGQNSAWFISSILVSLLGFYMWPQVFSSVYTAKGERALRMIAVTLPTYQLFTVFVTFVGFVALLQIPGLIGDKVDLALLEISIKSFDPWFVGVIGSAGMLAALVPGAVMVGAVATLLANDLYRRARPAATPNQIMLVAKLAVPLVSLIVVWFTLRNGQTLVSLLLLGYSFLTQLFPSLVASLMPRNPVTHQGAITGICVGAAIVLAITLSHATLADLIPDIPTGLRSVNIGIVALVFNVATMVVVSAFVRPVLAREPAETDS